MNVCIECGNLVNCICKIKEIHDPGCQYLKAAALSIELPCEHGFQACSICDPCDCTANIPQEELEDLR